MSTVLAPVIGTLRAPFLVLTPACVLLGIATAAHADRAFDFTHAWLALLGALSAHVSVNTFNEYLDFRSGLDALTKRTPFSGGSGSLPAHPHAAPATLAVAVASLLLTAGIGAYFISQQGMMLMPVGLLGLFLVVAYTNTLTRHPWACLIGPGLGFGLMTLGTHIAVAGAYAPSAFAAAMVPFFQVGNLLLLNQFPDVDADHSVGRRHLPIALGRPRSARVYAVFSALAYATLVGAVVVRVLPASALLGLATLPLSAIASLGVVRHADRVERLARAMGLNVVVSLLTPVLIAVGLMLR